ncbi:MAG: DUF58 domain-containing protein [Pseudonocardiaceae bacterium]|nr:DUF58 domain-containing protein [Pseudonocardiaceae bacterium]
MRGSLSGLTTRGRCLTAAGLAAALCAVVLNERDLLRVSVFVVALPMLVATLTARTRVRLAARRTLTPSRVPVGGSGDVGLEVWTTGRLPTGGLLLEDGVPYALGARPRFVVQRLPRRTGVRLSYPVQPVLRGIHPLGPLRVKVADPFGLTEFDRELAGQSALTVVPKVVPLTGAPAGAGLGAGSDGSMRLHAGQGDNDVIVRPYRHGDDLRKVHWRSTARRDEMMVRVEERPWRGGTTVLIDHRAAAHQGDGPASSLEWAVSFAASVCLHLRRHGYRVRLATEGGHVLTESLGEGSSVTDNAILDSLAALRPSHQRDLVCTRDLGAGQELIAVLGAASAESVAELNQHRPRGIRSLAVLLDTPAWTAPSTAPVSEPTSQATDLLRGSGWSVTIARPSSPMPRVWTELCQASKQQSSAQLDHGRLS